MPFCPDCGTRVSEEARFCPECGERLKKESTREGTEQALSKESPNGAKPIRWQDKLEIWLKRWIWLVITIGSVAYFVWFYLETKFTLFLWLIIPIAAIGLLFTWGSRKS